jgi:type II secretory pathway pseudopilin PulG
MKLRGQSESGYAMAALLVALSIAAVMMTVVMPVWKQMTRREKEEELIFRGQQYARAIRLFQRKYANATPPTIDVLVDQRFLRKKYKDPITNDDFVPLMAGQTVPSGPGAAAPPAPAADRGGIGGQQGAGLAPIGTPGAGGRGGIMGVASKSKEASIRIYNGRTHYNEWAFVYTPPAIAPGSGAPGAAAPGPGRGQRGPGGQEGPPGSFGPGRGGERGRGGPGRGGPGGGFGGPNGPNDPGGRGVGNPGGFNPFQPVPPAPNTPPRR